MEPVIYKITVMLEQSIGLSVTSIGDVSLKRALGSRKKALGIDDDEVYLDKLSTSFMELRRLVEEVVVPETWFFRDQEPFTFLKEYIANSSKDLSYEVFRILSIPCSTGEEPYSIAMTLLQGGLKPTSFYIDAVDVSNRSLSAAKTGLYKKNSFRTRDIEFRDNFFTKTEAGFLINSAVRDKVRFVHGNILQPGFLESLGKYDVAFCRNLLIYFNKTSQDKAIKGLHELLVNDGLLFTGHSEASLFMGTGFEPIHHSRAFAFKKKEPKESPSWLPAKLRKKSSLPAVPRSQMAFPASNVELLNRERKKTSAVTRNLEDQLAEVRQLADSGDLAEAAHLGEKYVQEYGPSADWYYLLGIIRESQGESEEAFKFFRKAVYLDPDHADSLIQLALLAERAGNADSAENYKRRARKILEKG